MQVSGGQSFYFENTLGLHVNKFEVERTTSGRGPSSEAYSSLHTCAAPPTPWKYGVRMKG